VPERYAAGAERGSHPDEWGQPLGLSARQEPAHIGPRVRDDQDLDRREPDVQEERTSRVALEEHPRADQRRTQDEGETGSEHAATAVNRTAAMTAYGISSPGYSERKSPFLAAEMMVVLAELRNRNAAITLRVRPSPPRILRARASLLKVGVFWRSKAHSRHDGKFWTKDRHPRAPGSASCPPAQ